GRGAAARSRRGSSRAPRRARRPRVRRRTAAARTARGSGATAGRTARSAAGGQGVLVAVVPVVGEPEVEGDERAAPVGRLEVLQPRDRAGRPGGERASDLGLERAVPAEDGGGL